MTILSQLSHNRIVYFELSEDKRQIIISKYDEEGIHLTKEELTEFIKELTELKNQMKN